MKLADWLNTNLRIFHKVVSVPTKAYNKGVYFVYNKEYSGLYIVSVSVENEKTVKKIFDSRDFYLKSDIPNLEVGIKQYRDPVQTIRDLKDLPIEGNTIGDARMVMEDKNANGDSMIWLWDGKTWQRTVFYVFPKDVAKKDDLQDVADNLSDLGKVVVDNYNEFVEYKTANEDVLAEIAKTANEIKEGVGTILQDIKDCQEATQDAIKATEDANEAEEIRATAEKGRIDAEEIRVKNEDERIDAEKGRIDAEEIRVKNEDERIEAEQKRHDDTDAALEEVKTATDKLNIQTEHRDEIREDGWWYRWDEELQDFKRYKKAKSDLILPVFEYDPNTGFLEVEMPEELSKIKFEINKGVLNY